MKKLTSILAIFTAIMAASFSTNAQSNSARTIDADFGKVGYNVKMSELVDLLKQVQAYVFLSKGEERNLTDIFSRTDSINFAADMSQLEWSVANEQIATVRLSDAVIYGNNFGETFLTAYDPVDGTNSYFAVFVCPTITVVSPEGVIYKYQKIYNQPAKITFSQSKDYLVNCVMFGDKNVTRYVAAQNGDGDGYFESADSITSDMVFTISEESREENESNEVVGNSGIDLQVLGHTVRFVDSDGTHDLANANVHITTLAGTDVFNGRMPSDCRITINDLGVFLVYISGFDGHFKIIIHDIK